MKLRSLLLTLLVICFSLSLSAKVLIWDIGGVLYKPSRFGIAQQVGLSNFLGYALFEWRNPKQLEPLVFEVLYEMECPALPDKTQAFTGNGIPLPPIMCHWQAGTISGEQIIDRTDAHIAALAEREFFISRREQNLIRRLIYTMFDPYVLAENMYPIRPGVRLLRNCAHAVGPDGGPRNYLIALSNWDPASFDIFYDIYEKDLSHFDELVISGKTGLIKPRKQAYQDLITRYNLDPQECLVIDDQEINLEAAEELGLNTFHVHRRNYRELRNVLIEFGALP